MQGSEKERMASKELDNFVKVTDISFDCTFLNLEYFQDFGKGDTNSSVWHY